MWLQERRRNGSGRRRQADASDGSDERPAEESGAFAYVCCLRTSDTCNSAGLCRMLRQHALLGVHSSGRGKAAAGLGRAADAWAADAWGWSFDGPTCCHFAQRLRHHTCMFDSCVVVTPVCADAGSSEVSGEAAASEDSSAEDPDDSTEDEDNEDAENTGMCHLLVQPCTCAQHADLCD